jgi:acetolactate synthase-1/2/3 large subunit
MSLNSFFTTPLNTTHTYPQATPKRTLSATHLNIEARSSLSKSVELINNSKQPVTYVGQGIFGHPDGPKTLASLSNNGNIPVTATFHALGSFDEEDPKALHMLGTHGAWYANLAVQNADIILHWVLALTIAPLVHLKASHLKPSGPPKRTVVASSILRF